MLLIDAFHAGGWPMYPILIAGTLLIVAAVQYAKRPEEQPLILVRELRILTVALGALGSLLGVIHSLSGLREVVPDQRNLILAMGVSECINDIGLALLLTIIAAAISATGSFRAARSS